AGREEQLADTEVGAVAVPVDAHHVTSRVGRRTLVEPAGLVLGGVERAVTTEAAALHGAQAGGPDLRGVPRRVEAAEQFPDVQRAVRTARHARRHRVALRALGHREEGDDLGRAVAMDVHQSVGAGVYHIAVPVRVEHGVGVGVREILGCQVAVGIRPGPVLVTDVGDDPDRVVVRYTDQAAQFGQSRGPQVPGDHALGRYLVRAQPEQTVERAV